MIRAQSSRAALAALLLCLPVGAAGLPGGSFIQLHRGVAGQTAGAWLRTFEQMKALGIDTVVVQWTAQPGISYFTADEKIYPEQYDVVDRILRAAETTGMAVYLGLHHDPDYWQQITGRDRVIKDYFYVRTAFNVRVQEALLKAFGDRACWKGTYIPDEVDDLNWRTGARADLMREYLARLTARLKRNDADREVVVSTFYRLRTEPQVYADNLKALMTDSGLDAVLVQDGIGDGIPWKYAQRYAPVYYKALHADWPEDAPALWAVAEVFERSTAEGEDFVARTAAPERVEAQLALLVASFSRTFYFSFPDYMAPEGSPAARALYEKLRQRRK